MLSLDFADTAIIEIIATAKIIAAIAPNSGITKVPIISISSAPAGKSMVSVLSVADFVSVEILLLLRQSRQSIHRLLRLRVMHLLQIWEL